MKKHLKWISVVFALIFSLGILVGCGETKSSSEPKNSQQQTQTQEKSQTENHVQDKAMTSQPSTTPSTSNSQSAPPVETPAPAPQPEKQSYMVYVTNTGKKYHRDGCRYLSKSKIPISLDEAKNEGYGPCSVCNPPT